MKKIAILRCLESSASCTGASCLRSMYERKYDYEQYGNENLQLMAMWTCNGCGESKLANQEGVVKKIERIKTMEVDALHLTSCTFKKNDIGERVICPIIKDIADELKKSGIKIIEGFD